MRFAFTKDQELLRDGLRDVLKRECPPAAVRAAWSGERHPHLWRTLAEVGVLGLTVPEEHGGMGLGSLEMTALLEEAGRFAAPVPLLDTMAVAAPLLRDVGHTAPLAAIAKGEARVSVGLSGAYVLGAAQADLLLLVRDGALHGVRPADTTIEAEPSVDGARPLARVRWTPKPETLLASPDAAIQPLADAFDRGALGASAELLGLAQRMIEMAVEYAKVRKQFGAPIGSFQAVKHHLASALLKVEFARPAVYRAAYSMAQNDPERSVHVSMGKACASDAATHAARAALQCHGAIGYSYEHDLHLWMKRAWALAASFGDADWHRARVATAILGQEES